MTARRRNSTSIGITTSARRLKGAPRSVNCGRSFSLMTPSVNACSRDVTMTSPKVNSESGTTPHMPTTAIQLGSRSVVLGIIWRKSLSAIWRKAWACRSWRSCRQRLGILRYHASGCLNHTLSSIDRRGRRGSSFRTAQLFLAVTPNREQRFTPHSALTYIQVPTALLQPQTSDLISLAYDF
jgi:hypothetical protein